MTAPATHGRRRIVFNAAANWLGFAANIAAAFYLFPILVRGLGQERYGLWSLVDGVLAYLTLLDLGIAASLVRYTARFDAIGERDNLNRVFSACLLLFAAAGLVAFLIAASVGLFGLGLLGVVEEFRAETTWLLLLLGFNFAVGLPLNVFSSLLDGLGRYPAKTAIRTAGLLLRLPLCLWLVHGDGALLRLAFIVSGCTLLEHLAIAVAAWCYLPSLRFTPRQVDRQTLRTIGGYSTDAFLGMLAGRISFQTDALVINFFLGLSSITPFRIAHSLVEQAKNALRAGTTVLTPAVSSWEARQNDDAIRKLLLDGTRWVQWLIIPVQVGLLVLGRSFLGLWMGPEIQEQGYWSLLILTVPLGLAMAQSIAARILYGVGKLRLFARVVIGEAAVNLVMSIILVVPFGIEGVAFGTALPNLISNAVVIGYTCSLFGVKGGDYVRQTMLAPLVLGSLLACGWVVSVNLAPIDSWLMFFLTGTAGMAVYLPCAALVEFGPKALGERISGWVGRRLALLRPGQ